MRSRDKRDDSLYVRIPHELKRKLQKHAAKNLRNLNQDICFLIDLGLHVEDFTVGAWSEDEANDNET